MPSGGGKVKTTYRTVGGAFLGAGDVGGGRGVAVAGGVGGLFGALDEDLGADELVEERQRARVVRLGLAGGGVGGAHAADDVLHAAHRGAVLQERAAARRRSRRRFDGLAREALGGRVSDARRHGALAAASGLGSARLHRLLAAHPVDRHSRSENQSTVNFWPLFAE